MDRQLFVRSVTKADGRALTFYGWHEHKEKLGAELPPLEPSQAPYRRWHALRQEWVSYAGVRQGRTFLPDAASCPLCPSKPDQGLTEIPARDFEVCVFENRFPAFRMDAAEGDLLEGTSPSVGQCEVVVFSPAHEGSLGSQSIERIELLFELWARQSRQMMDKQGLAAVLPFETRGEEIGVTLPHPHGQIYGFDFVPDLLRKSAEAQKKEPVIAQLLANLPAELVLDKGNSATSFVPDIARYPYETWIVPNRRVSGPWDFTPDERFEMAAFLKRALLRLDGLFGRPMPYVLSAQLAPKGYEESYHFSVQIWPLRRDVDKMKYLASVEQISGIFLVDVPPERAAEQLKAVKLSA